MWCPPLPPKLPVWPRLCFPFWVSASTRFYASRSRASSQPSGAGAGPGARPGVETGAEGGCGPRQSGPGPGWGAHVWRRMWSAGVAPACGQGLVESDPPPLPGQRRCRAAGPPAAHGPRPGPKAGRVKCACGGKEVAIAGLSCRMWSAATTRPTASAPDNRPAPWPQHGSTFYKLWSGKAGWGSRARGVGLGRVFGAGSGIAPLGLAEPGPLVRIPGGSEPGASGPGSAVRGPQPRGLGTRALDRGPRARGPGLGAPGSRTKGPGSARPTGPKARSATPGRRPGAGPGPKARRRGQAPSPEPLSPSPARPQLVECGALLWQGRRSFVGGAGGRSGCGGGPHSTRQPGHCYFPLCRKHILHGQPRAQAAGRGRPGRPATALAGQWRRTRFYKPPAASLGHSRGPLSTPTLGPVPRPQPTAPLYPGLDPRLRPRPRPGPRGLGADPGPGCVESDAC